MSEVDVKGEIKEELEKLVGRFIPNKIDLDNFCNYLCKLSMNKITKGKSQEVNDMDRKAFLRAVHTLSVFSARDLMFKTMHETFNNLRNQVNLVEVDHVKAGNIEHSNTHEVTDSGKLVIIPADEGNFNIDLSDKKLKVDQKVKSMLKDEIEKESGVQRRVNSEKYIQWSNSDKEFNIGNDSLQEFNKSTPKTGTNTSFMSDASSFTDESYYNIPEVSKDLDY